MARGVAGIAIVFAAALAVAGCGSAADPTMQPLHTLPSARPVVATACNTALMAGVLHGDPKDPWRVWVTPKSGGRVDVVWPHGFTVAFAPAAEVFAPDLSLIAREGDTLTLGGGLESGAFYACVINGRDWQLGPAPSGG